MLLKLFVATLYSQYYYNIAPTLLLFFQIESITKEQIEEISVLTAAQSDSDYWVTQRKLRLTSSNFGKVVKSGNQGRLAINLLNTKPFNSRATQHGKSYEGVAIKKYEAMMGTPVERCGLAVCQDYPFLGASPDGLVGGDICVEIKCPYSVRSLNVTKENMPFLNEKGLKKSHDYYYQVQGQLLCTNRSICHFCIFTFADFRVFEIERDDDFIADMVDKLKAFYVNHFKPALLEKHVYRHYSRYF